MLIPKTLNEPTIHLYTFQQTNTVQGNFFHREKIEEFKSKMPVIRTLGNPGFRDRHWENVSNIVGFPVKGGSNLFQILDMGLDEYVSKFEKIRYQEVT